MVQTHNDLNLYSHEPCHHHHTSQHLHSFGASSFAGTLAGAGDAGSCPRCYGPDDIVVSKSCYDDFSMPTSFRRFEIYAGDTTRTTFYVNAGWLAEMSPFFAALCFGDRAPRGYFIDDHRPAEVLEFLRCICYCPTRKPLTVHNVALVLRLATRFEMRPVMARCEMFIAQNVNTLDRHKLFQVACAVSQCDPHSASLAILVDRLARMKDAELSTFAFQEMPGDVVAEVFAQRARDKATLKKKRAFCCIM